MTAETVRLDNLGAMFTEDDPLWNLTRVKKQDIFHPVDGFPQVMADGPTVGQVVVHTANAPVSAGMVPSRVLVFHDMTTGTERRRF